jgi:hypothetical protein
MGVGASNPLLTISLRSIESNPTSLKLRTGRGTSRPGEEGSGLKIKIRVKGSGLKIKIRVKGSGLKIKIRVKGSGLKIKIRVKGSGLGKFAIKIMYYLQLPLLSPIDSPILPLLTC